MKVNSIRVVHNEMDWRTAPVEIYTIPGQTPIWDANTRTLQIPSGLGAYDESVQLIGDLETVMRNVDSLNFVFKANHHVLDDFSACALDCTSPRRIFAEPSDEYKDLLRFVFIVNSSPAIGQRIGIRLNPRLLRRQTLDSTEFCLVTTNVVHCDLPEPVSVPGQFFPITECHDGAVAFSLAPSPRTEQVIDPSKLKNNLLDRQEIDVCETVKWKMFQRDRGTIIPEPNMLCRFNQKFGLFVGGIQNHSLVYSISSW